MNTNEQAPKQSAEEFNLTKLIEDVCEDWGLKCTHWEGDTHYEATKEAKEDLHNKIQQRISDLEATVKMQREALEEITRTNWVNGKYFGKSSAQLHLMATKIAEQALKEKTNQ